jgi:transposase InsO family protein
MMTFLDEFPGYGSIICLKHKSDAVTTFCNQFALAEKASGNKLLKLHLDHGGEYTSLDLRTFVSANGIEHQLTIPYTPQ